MMDLYEAKKRNPQALSHFGINNFEILKAFELYYHMWECDGYGWIIRDLDTGNKHFIATDHGSFRLEKADTLKGHVEEYEALVSETRAALALLVEN